MRSIALVFIAAICYIACTTALPAKGTASGCVKACPFNYAPICAAPQTGTGPNLSFGNDCVLNNYNCEHSNARYVMKTKGECPGSTGIRLQ